MGRYTNKKVLIRVEYNVPLDKKGNITDNTRIKASIPTLKKILGDKPKQLVLMFHLGRPKDREKIFQTDKVADELGKLLKRKVVKVDHCGEGEIPEVPIVMLENLRFYPGEKKGDVKFAKQLASLADVYVNESFGTCHRKDASMYVVPKYFDEKKRFAGELLKNEIKKLNEVEKSKDLTVIVGFAKISDKIGVLKKLLKKATRVYIGGKVIFAFLKAQGLSIGKVEIDDVDVDIAAKLLKTYGKKIITPVDFVGHKAGRLFTCAVDNMPANFIGYDVGSKTIDLWSESLMNSKIVFWNGPLGFFEKKPFDLGSNKLSAFLAKNNKGIKTIVGGGDTVSAVKLSGLGSKMYHLSTGGGASLSYIEKGKLPALKWVKI